MKIIFINRYFYPDESATSQILTDLAFELCRDKQDVAVITSRQRYDDKNASLLSQETVNGVRVYRVATTRFGRKYLAGRALDYLTFYFGAFAVLLNITSRGDLVVAKTDPPLICVVAMAAARFKGATLINWVQDLFPEVAESLGVKGLQGVMAKFLRYLRNVSCRCAALNVVIGESMSARLCGQGISKNRIRVIPNWSNGRHLKPVLTENNFLRKEWNLNGKFVVGYSGNLGRAHEFQTVLDAAENLKADTRFIFLFIGDGQKKDWLEREVQRKNLGNFLFKPFQPMRRLSESLSVPDVHLISLKAELEGLVFPSKFYGAAAVGRPILYVGDSRGEIPSMLSAQSFGETIGIGDNRGLVERLRQWANDPAAVRTMGKKARDFFELSLDRPIRLRAWKEALELINYNPHE